MHGTVASTAPLPTAPFGASRHRPSADSEIEPDVARTAFRVSDSAPGSGKKVPSVPLAKVRVPSSLPLISTRSDCGSDSERKSEPPPATGPPAHCGPNGATISFTEMSSKKTCLSAPVKPL